MSKLSIEITDYRVARHLARQILVGSAFAFIAPKPSDDTALPGRQNVDGFLIDEHRTIALLPDPQILPGFKLHTATRPFKVAPVLLPDKEIYRAIHDTVRLLLIAPDWLRAKEPGSSSTQPVAQLVIEKNSYIYRTQTVELASIGLTLVELTLLPEGNYRVYWNREETTNYRNNTAECRFSVVEYVLSPLQATLLSHELQGSSLNCRLQVERFQEPCHETVRLELWSEQRLTQQQLAPVAPGIYQANFNLESNTPARLELRVNVREEVATVVIPGSRREERDETILSRLGRQVSVSLMPREAARAVRGLYLSESSTVTHTPVIIIDPAPANRRAQLRWTVAAQAARLLVLDLQGTVVEQRDLGDVVEMTLTRERFEELCSDLIERCRIAIEIALRDAQLNAAALGYVSLSKSDINEVVLVGGSTQIPAVQALVRQMLDKEPQQSINPDEVVALGAAIQASVLSGEVRDILLLDDDTFGLPGAMTLNPAPRSDFADIAYCGIVRTDELGRASLSFRLPDAIASYNIEAFALSESGTEWCSTKKRLDVSKLVWAEFKLPKFIYPGDKSPATVDVSCSSGQFRLRLLCDGVSVPFSLVGALQTAADSYTGQRAQVMFEAQPGQWRVEVEDLVTQECDVAERTVDELGRFKGLARRFQLLLPGETLERQAHRALQLQLLPSLGKPFNLLCEATADYEFHCCEQTAAKLLAAVTSLMAGGGLVKLRDVILAGVAREQRMHLPGRGLALYPPEEMGGMAQPNDYWGKIAAEHLCSLGIVQEPLLTLEATQSDPEVQQALQIAITIGEDAAFAYKLPLVPTQIESGRDAYRALMRSSPARDEALPYARRSLQPSTADRKKLQGAVLSRAEQAYCAAALLVGSNESDRALAVAAANQLANSLDSNGRLYSTVDSIALLGLMMAIRTVGIGASGTVRVLLNGRAMSLAEAIEVSSTNQIDAIAVLEGAAFLELTTEVIEDWHAFRADVPVQVRLVIPQERTNGLLCPGDTVELVVEVERYEPGLLVQVCLPPALSRLEGGGEVKRFSVDLCGRSVVRVPLVVTSHTLPPGEHWTVVVSNMFSEEQTGNPGLLRVQVSAN